MTGAAPGAPARLLTTFGTLVHVDPRSGELRHGPIDTSPANTVLAPELRPDGAIASGRLTFRADTESPVVCSPARCGVGGDDGVQSGQSLELAPLERGLFALRRDGLFLSAQPDGGFQLSRPICSTWECFIGSETWCSSPGETDWMADGASVDRRAVKHHIVDPVHRAALGGAAAAPKLLLYGYPRWSHGRVHYEISKRLARLGYVVDLLDWQQNHADSIEALKSYYDLVMTPPDGVGTLVDVYGVPEERLIVVSHHEFDIRMLIERKGIEVFDRVGAFGVVSEALYSASMMQGVRRPPLVAPLGVDFAEFAMPIPERLETVGYASSMEVSTFGVEWKRGHLAEEAAQQAGLVFKVAGSTAQQLSFHDMPAFYRSVDAILVSSISESGPLPVLEAAAAGRLVIGTPVGHFPLKAYQGGGILAPIEADKFTGFAAATLRYYAAHPAEFSRKCWSIREAASQFDWAHSIGDWKALLESVQARVLRRTHAH